MCPFIPKEVFRIDFNRQIEAQTVLRHAHINIQLLVRVQPSPATGFHLYATVSFNRPSKF